MPASNAFSVRRRAAASGSGRAAAILVDYEFVVVERIDGFDALGLSIPLDSAAGDDAIGEEVEQPVGLDLAGEADQGQRTVTAVFDIDGDEEIRRCGGDGWAEAPLERRTWPLLPRRATRSGNAARTARATASGSDGGFVGGRTMRRSWSVDRTSCRGRPLFI